MQAKRSPTDATTGRRAADNLGGKGDFDRFMPRKRRLIKTQSFSLMLGPNRLALAVDVSRVSAYNLSMAAPRTIQLKELCGLFDFEVRQVRFVLEQGYVPRGVDENPSTGNRREFGPRQAFCLAITVMLKTAGLKTPVAAELANEATEGLRIIAQNFHWDSTFFPAGGWFETDHQYFLDIGDATWIRLRTSASPSKPYEEFGWVTIRTPRKKIEDPKPLVTICLDLTRIAAKLAKVEGWSCPHREPAQT